MEKREIARVKGSLGPLRRCVVPVEGSGMHERNQELQEKKRGGLMSSVMCTRVWVNSEVFEASSENFEEGLLRFAPLPSLATLLDSFPLSILSQKEAELVQTK
ncbi:hypothetical protein PM082_013713 [Marasmius tenuissimus]|nr:hypothetical protein PM082_013713 [Marasmius tenuissimus]